MHKHALYANIDTLLSPETLSEIAQERVASVRVEPLVSALSASGNRFLSVKTRGARDWRYVVKRLNWDWDWLMQASDDRGCRERPALPGALGHGNGAGPAQPMPTRETAVMT